MSADNTDYNLYYGAWEMPLSGKDLVKIYRQNGWLVDRIKGSHHIMVNPLTSETVPIPVHANRSLKKGLERALLKKLRQTP